MNCPRTLVKVANFDSQPPRFFLNTSTLDQPQSNHLLSNAKECIGCGAQVSPLSGSTRSLRLTPFCSSRTLLLFIIPPLQFCRAIQASHFERVSHDSTFCQLAYLPWLTLLQRCLLNSFLALMTFTSITTLTKNLKSNPNETFVHLALSADHHLLLLVVSDLYGGPQDCRRETLLSAV